MAKKIVAVLVISLWVSFAGTSFAEREREKTVVSSSQEQEEQIDPNSPWWWEYWGEDEPDD